jgi:hypothetical protein
LSDQIRSREEAARDFLKAALRTKPGCDAILELRGQLIDRDQVDEMSDAGVEMLAARVTAWMARYFERLGGRVSMPASAAYLLAEHPDGHTSITCATCFCTSHNANDVRAKYCGHCHRFLEDV